MKTLNGFEFVAQQTTEVQELIELTLTNFFATESDYITDEEIAEHVENGMDSKLSDLTDTIDFEAMGVELV